MDPIGSDSCGSTAPLFGVAQLQPSAQAPLRAWRFFELGTSLSLAARISSLEGRRPVLLNATSAAKDRQLAARRGRTGAFLQLVTGDL